MPIRSMFFSGASGRGIHLIRGDLQHNTSRVIRDVGLAFMEIPATGADKAIFATEYFKNHSKNIDVVLDFAPTFKHTDVVTNPNRENFGIHVNRTTGTVLVDPGPIAKPFPSNF